MQGQRGRPPGAWGPGEAAATAAAGTPRSVPGQSSLSPHQTCGARGPGRARRPGRLQRCSAARAGAADTKAAAEAPARPLAHRPSRRSRAAGAASRPPSAAPVRRGLLSRRARGPLVNPCPPARPLIGGGGAPGPRGPPPPRHTFRVPSPTVGTLPPSPGTPPFASQPCKSREETRGFTSVFTPITTNPDRTDPD